jgi:hypothetical protein
MNSPQSCGGNACADLEWTEVRYHPGTITLSRVTLTNRGPKALNFEIWWGNALGGCGVGSSGSIPPGRSVEIPLRSELMIVGACSYSANH